MKICGLTMVFLSGQVEQPELEDEVGYIYLMSTHASILVNSVGPSSAEVCRTDRKSTRLNSSHITRSRMPSSA